MSPASSLLKVALPFVVAVALGATVTLALRAGLASDAPDTHGESMDHSAHEMGAEEMPGMEQESAAAPESTGLLVDLGNTQCPIMGNDVNGKVFSEWRGLRVGHCCPPCADDFQKAPEKALDDLGVLWRPLVAKIAAAEVATGADQARLLDEIRAEHTIVRGPESAR